jgi:hydrogenase maturation protein HypF
VTAQGRRIQIRGTVQGVGFRPWVYRLARQEGISGRVRNDTAGVTIEAFGADPALDAFLRSLRQSPPPAARIRDFFWEKIPSERPDGFRIVESEASGELEVSIPPDLATCPDCLSEIFDPADRRFRYPFTNCTNCGPRFTIACGIPYDRPETTMASFSMCADCAREYDSPEDRRFHAQPNACPACGPRLRALSSTGQEIPYSDPISAAARALEDGLIVAIKGIGGFHLACDAASPAAVRRLRERKRRDEKPFAVMVRGLPEAARMAELSDEERQLLASVERPIVLAARRADAPVCLEVAPGNRLIGLLLPYTPLHHLLLAATDRPLVMTSGNLSEEPIVHRDRDAAERLGGIADLILAHDREIATRCDDSVSRVIAGRPTVFRRSRGYAPRPISVRHSFERPVLACGAQLKNTFCIGLRDAAYLGPHIGDLENLESYRSFEEAVERMQRFLDVRPEVIAHDLHPGYLSTSYAVARAETVKIPVQHHHAHVASAMAEHGLPGPVIGVAYDGTGYGTDGTAWGGEILLADQEGYQRLATFRPIPLAGSDRAIREIWRIALALLDDAFPEGAPLDAFPVFGSISEYQVGVVRRMIATGTQSPLARGVGRYFDAMGSLFLGRPTVRYEGQSALEWDMCADPAESGAYPFEIDTRQSPWTLDLRPLLLAAVGDFLAGRPASTISARFHNTLARATAKLVRGAGGAFAKVPVVLTGGCFQNARLAEGILGELSKDYDVYLHQNVPPGDGGIALGQAVVAGAIARKLGGGF